ncbi:MAG: glycosyltransferase family 1 protein [Pseudomonadota bacterium]
MRIALVTDAWFPQINGVVRTLDCVKKELESEGHRFEVIHPKLFPTIACPTYPDIRLACWTGGGVKRRIEAFGADALHIATEGPLGQIARCYCLRRGRAFTSAYHTRFPEYIAERAPVPLALSYKVVRAFHRPSSGVMVATPALARELESKGFRNLRPWSRGVDSRLFRPRAEPFYDKPKPIFLYVGRVAVEKNIQAFLELDLPGSKVVVGDGPQRSALQQAFPETYFAGARHGEDLARHYSGADVFIFPSRTDTFGLVVLEALASGLPIAAYPVTGPRDVLGQSGAGVLDDDLGRAALAALEIPKARCRAFAETFSWQATARLFLSYLHAH